jgi:hypothetical protein
MALTIRDARVTYASRFARYEFRARRDLLLRGDRRN